MWLKFGVLSKGLFSHLKVEKMRVEVENKIWIKTKIVTTFFSKKRLLAFSKERICKQTILQTLVEKTFFFIFNISSAFEGFLQTAMTSTKDVSMSI